MRRQLVKNEARGGGSAPFCFGLFLFFFFLSLPPGTPLRPPPPSLRIPAAQRAVHTYLKRPCGEGVPPRARCAGPPLPAPHLELSPLGRGRRFPQGATLHPMNTQGVGGWGGGGGREADSLDIDIMRESPWKGR